MRELNQEMIEKIAKMVPPELRDMYYMMMMRLPNISEHDEFLWVLQVLLFFMIVAEQVPGLMTEEREKLERLCAELIKTANEQEIRGRDCFKTLYDRLVALPTDILKGLDPKAFVAQINETLVRLFNHTTIPGTALLLDKNAKAIEAATAEHKKASDKLCGEWNSAAEKARKAIQEIEAVPKKVEAAISGFLADLDGQTKKALVSLRNARAWILWLTIMQIGLMVGYLGLVVNGVIPSPKTREARQTQTQHGQPERPNAGPAQKRTR
jgi:hypothetical protein